MRNSLIILAIASSLLTSSAFANSTTTTKKTIVTTTTAPATQKAQAKPAQAKAACPLCNSAISPKKAKAIQSSTKAM